MNTPHPAPDAADAGTRFFGLLLQSLQDRSLIKLSLGKYRGPEPDLERLLLKRVNIKEQDSLSFVYRYKTRDITKNLPLPAALDTLRGLIGQDFRAAHLQTAKLEAQIDYTKKGKASLHLQQLGADAPAEAAPEHNREKHRFLELSRPFLAELGVTNAQHQLVPAMARKWKQINKFVEVFSHAFASSRLAAQAEAGEPISVVDFGSGKGYLTFAIHDYLHNTLRAAAKVTGVELRPDMVGLCNTAVRKLGLQGLRFEQGDVRSYQPEAIDVMIALHACDTATDYAIHMGLQRQAAIIMCSPCCHKQIRPQMTSPALLRPMLQHGIHMGQEAEMVTDSLRALLLDAHGYDTQVFEFISLEHTSKNKMILAVRRAKPQLRPEVLEQIAQIKAFYGIREQCLETLLQADAPAC